VRERDLHEVQALTLSGLGDSPAMDPEWATHRLDCAHDIPWLVTEALAKILLKYA